MDRFLLVAVGFWFSGVVSAMPVKTCKGKESYAYPLPNKVWNKEYDIWLTPALQSARSPTGKILGQTRIEKSIYEILVLAQGPKGLPKDMDRLCPKFQKLTTSYRIQFWQRFLRAVAKSESAFDYNSVYHESWAGPDWGYSVGLLQLSTEDNEQWGCQFSRKDACAPTDQKENLECGAEVFALQMALCGTFFQGMSTSTDCEGHTAHGVGPDYSFYFAVLNPKDAGGMKGFNRFVSHWAKMTGWDLQTRKPTGKPSDGELKFCY